MKPFLRYSRQIPINVPQSGNILRVCLMSELGCLNLNAAHPPFKHVYLVQSENIEIVQLTDISGHILH